MREHFDTDERYLRALDLIDAKVHRTDSCHEWTGPVKGNGYGQITLTVGRRETKNFYAHRLIYSLTYGMIPSGKEIHHRCFNRKCVNPEHLSVVSHAENMAMLNPKPRVLSKTCSFGHEFSDENTLWSSGRRICRECKRRRERDARLRKAATR